MNNAIEIINLSKQYEGFTLSNISLDLPKGCVMGLIGENGAGKSTIIKLIFNSIKRSGGSIEVLGCDNMDKDFEKIKEDIGVVLDEPCFPECVKLKDINAMMKNIYKNWSSEQFWSYCDRFALPGNKRFKSFSKGMKMKASIAVAMSHGARLLVLDEATSGLDPIIRDEILDIFNEFTRDEEHSILVSSHIISDLEKICDYIAFIHKGRLKFCEEKDVLLEKYLLIHCSEEDFKKFTRSRIIGYKRGKYEIEALVTNGTVPAGVVSERPGIEEIMLFMTKESV
ncbi:MULTISPECIES: ABC transporter ATP-binding protein [unclassified Ruminococcus]|uniref:ABC transporter ATP-binding protein n=1 Tax=unclassified Ruminococcus TaxID=2608920 RepID=UPI00210E968F|nr:MULTISPECIES: ABC transporter ATP-binding protein [unclassified Ruminococcus]MCQ4023031.1 ATP-binding cassette domain-containing protein [Ruminococcus sp. zg-924]MCQ4115468.1 ATP-binding cassette domain-containing protein [Ruminococcus sp. zg-921]